MTAIEPGHGSHRPGYVCLECERLADQRPHRRQTDPDCSWCQKWQGQGPAHDASPNCESGGHSHCTCDTCF
jgi:hypothetical protein